MRRFRLLTGAVAGCLATFPMTVLMERLHRKLPVQEQYPIPPSEITAKLTADVGLQPSLTPEQHRTLILLAHFGYGSTAGALYNVTAAHLPAPLMVRDLLFGLCVWIASYLGLLPVLGILRPATQHPPRRTALMIVAHAVWGVTLALLVQQSEHLTSA